MSRQYHAPSRAAAQKKAPQFTAPSVARPTVQKKSAAKSLPPWNPEGPTVDPLARLSQTPSIQTKLTVGAANDKYEQEADRVAKNVVQRIHSPLADPSTESIQRETLDEEEDLQTKPLLQRQTAADGGDVSSDLESSIKKAKGGGQSLNTNLQAKMGEAMGADFSGVKVHTDSQSDQLNQAVQAKAFTTGSDVFFRKGEYNPGSKGGQELIAHELTHVVQQNGGAVQTKSIHHTDASNESVQRLKWSEVYTGSTSVVGISESQMPEGVEAETGEQETIDRNVWAGQTKKGRSGFLWHKDSTLEIQYDIKSMKQYKIIDPTVVFFTAVRISALEPIKKFGIDPNFGNAEKPDGSTQYNVRGFNYFGKDKKIPQIYGSNYLEPEPWKIISFSLPEGTLIERDPEIPNGLRTTHHIQPSEIKSW
ncbi:DUF4157 domain-containing protein [Spirulina major]|uniref:eCIS core domain-containing protein n=1 Tax=Spirulina major TaxID=270636 RepID=UPI0009FEE13E|nr:DUF4157 domain-containing protein [Spirulina major]